MKKQTGDSGVKAVKLITEIEAIINDSKLTNARKIRLLYNVPIQGRPGADKAREMIDGIKKPFAIKYDNYLRHTLIHISGMDDQRGWFPRGFESAWGNKKMNWTERFYYRIEKEKAKAKRGITIYPYEIVQKIIGCDPYKSGKNYFDPLYHYKFGPSCKPIAWQIIQEVRHLVDASNEKNKAAIEFYETTGLSEIYLKQKPSITDFIHTLSCPSGYIHLGGFYITASETEGTDWDYYSKAWHRAHGPKRWIESRTLDIHTPCKGGIDTIPIDRWGAKNITEALAAYFKLKKPACPKGRKPVQLNDWFELKPTKTVNGYEIYERRFAGEHIDYAIFDTKTRNTYHHINIDELIPGLRKKLQARFDRENEVITKQTGYDLGFCETGMKQFCSDNNVDFEGYYTRQELRSVVVVNRDLNFRRYRKELAQIGISLGK